MARNASTTELPPALITSGGVSAGIDMSLYLVERLLGPAAKAKVVEEMEYMWHLKAYEVR